LRALKVPAAPAALGEGGKFACAWRGSRLAQQQAERLAGQIVAHHEPQRPRRGANE